jgi:hypothetical protein
MPSPALLLRCLLIVTLCLDGSLSLWSSSVMAVAEVRHAAADATAAVAAETDDVDCADAGTSDQSGAAHEDCDCGVGACGCFCLLSFAAITHAVPFTAQHTLAIQPVLPSPPHVPLSARTAVFRPPIG